MQVSNIWIECKMQKAFLLRHILGNSNLKHIKMSFLFMLLDLDSVLQNKGLQIIAWDVSSRFPSGSSKRKTKFTKVTLALYIKFNLVCTLISHSESFFPIFSNFKLRKQKFWTLFSWYRNVASITLNNWNILLWEECFM